MKGVRQPKKEENCGGLREVGAGYGVDQTAKGGDNGRLTPRMSSQATSDRMLHELGWIVVDQICKD